MRDTPIVRVGDLDIAALVNSIPALVPKKGHRYPKDRKTGVRYRYMNIVTAFDIETSQQKYGPHPDDWRSWMYHWQWQFGNRVTVIGRTWPEFLELVDGLNRAIPDDCRMMVYVHNLAFEFQFLGGIWAFSNDDVFATDKRDPLYCRMGKLELRCSARLSGYSLERWTQICRVDHPKTKDLDYRVERYPWTELTPEELRYCVHDVVGLVECVESEMAHYGDNLYTIPYTSTGYIRRVVKRSMRMWAPGAAQEMSGDLQTYDRLREAYRGGNTHANRYMAERLLENVYSYDRSSSYPDVICHCKFPMSKFRVEDDLSIEHFQHLIDAGRAVLLHVEFLNIRIRSEKVSVPYIPIDLCSRIGFRLPVRPEMDNGRILSADFCEISLTDIDFEILASQYDWDNIRIDWMMSARYGYLPRPLCDVCIDLYHKKTALKGVAGSEDIYNHSKAELNSIYGMMVQRVISQPVLYNGGDWDIAPFDREAEYAAAIQRAFLPYQWGVWVCCWARYRLQEAIDICDSMNTGTIFSPFVYADTDSVKCMSPIDLVKYNSARQRAARQSGAYAEDAKGRTHYMGEFESEGSYDWFRTLGSKRYCTVQDNQTVVTVSGVPKRAGSRELVEKGGIEQFNFNFVFEHSGKLGAVYNDYMDEWITVGGGQIHVTRNVALIDVAYSMKPGRDYARLLRALQIALDEMQHKDYNHKW